ncbi:hypothetical protein [Streptomyces sp. NPDC056061]|uniref:hypothetical protein n=1 Tax=Streptomyces sp. NPDC056061 TaxID=3345700 RepID=UPI0035E25DAD
MDFDVIVHHMRPPQVSAPTEPLTGAEANIRIRGLVVNSMADELWMYEVPDRDGTPLRIVARTQRTGKWELHGPRVVREVYEQAVTGSQVHELDWLERGGYEPPAPTRQPVKVGDRVTAMVDGYTVGPGLVSAIEWKVHPMQAHYGLPPLWHWEWRVVVWFGGDRTREGVWKDFWVGKADDALPGTRDIFEPMWARLEAEFGKHRATD